MPSWPLSTNLASRAWTSPKYLGEVFGQLEMLRAISEVFARVGLQRADHVDPVQGVQMVEVNDVILHVLGAKHQVPHHFGVRRHGDAQRVLDRADRGQGMHGRADAAGPLGKGPGVARIAPRKDLLEAAHHRARAVGVHDLPVFHFRFDAQMPLDAGDRVNDNSGSHQVPPSLLEAGGSLFLELLPDQLAFADIGQDGVGRDSGGRGRADRQADLVGGGLNAEAGERRQMAIERAVVPKLRLAATDAPVPRLNRKADAVVPAGDAAVVVRHRTSASHLVQAVPALGVLVVQGLDEQARVVIRTPVATVVDPAGVERLGPAELVQLREAVEGQQVDDRACHHLANRRAARDIDDGRAGYHLVNRSGAGRIGVCSLDAAVGRATAPAHDGLRPGGRLGDDIEGRPAADTAVDSAVCQRHRPLDQHQVLAPVLLHGIVQRLFGLLARCRLQGLGVVERDLVEQDVGHQRV